MRSRRQRRRCAPDRISELPEAILQHILSFLVVKDAAVMGTVSSNWNRAWNSLSFLHFGDAYVLHRLDMSKLVSFVNQTLAIRQHQNICVESFQLRLPYWRCWTPYAHNWTPYVHNWIKTLVACNVKALNLTINTPICREIVDYHRLPEEIFDAKALNVLHLRGFQIELPPSNIKFSSLQTLFLEFVFLNERFIEALSTNCCNLEILCLHWFQGLTSIQLGESLSKLHKVELGFICCPLEFDEVDIRAPNLVDLEMCQLRSHLKVFNITACKALRFLFVSQMTVTEKWVEDVSSLPDLQRLYLIDCKTLKTINISSVRLEHLLLHDCNLFTVELDTPNLKRFSYRCRSFPTLKLKASASLEPKISFDPETPDSDWYSKLFIFLANFNHYRAVELSSQNDEVIIIPNDMRESLVPPLYGTECLLVKFQNELKYSVVDIVDSLLWISPQLDSLSFHQADLKTLKFIYKDASNEDEKPCCTSLTLKCWRHKLKQVKMQNFTCMEQQELRNYFFENLDLIIDEIVGPTCENELQDVPVSGLGNLPRRSTRERLPNQKLADYICRVGQRRGQGAVRNKETSVSTSLNRIMEVE